MREAASELLQYYFHKYKLSTVLEKKKKKSSSPFFHIFKPSRPQTHLTCKPSTLLSDGEQPSAHQQQCFGPDFGKSGTALGTPPSHTLSARDSTLERRPQCLGMGKIREFQTVQLQDLQPRHDWLAPAVRCSQRF